MEKLYDDATTEVELKLIINSLQSQVEALKAENARLKGEKKEGKNDDHGGVSMLDFNIEECGGNSTANTPPQQTAVNKDIYDEALRAAGLDGCAPSNDSEENSPEYNRESRRREESIRGYGKKPGILDYLSSIGRKSQSGANSNRKAS